MRKFNNNSLILFTTALKCLVPQTGDESRSCKQKRDKGGKKLIPFYASFFRAGSLTFAFLLLPWLSYAQSGWGPDQRLVFMQGGGWYPRAVCCGDTIHLVWWQAYIGHDEVFYKRSTDAGWTWEADVLLSVEDSQSSVLPQVAVSGNIVHVIWHEEDFGILYRRSTNSGVTWQDIDSIIPGIGYSSIQAFNDTVYISGISGGILQFTKSIDGGNNWELPINITSASASPILKTISNNTLNLVVSYRGYPAVEIYHVRSFSAGELWTDSQVVSEFDSIGSQRPAMDTDDSSGIHITWYDYKYSPYPWTGDIFYRASRDSGNTWEPIDSLTVQHRAVASDILAEGNNLHLVWEDDRNDFGNNFEIYYRMSTDLGQTWGPEVRLTNELYWSIRPSLACGGGYLHLFWQDRREYGNNGSSAPLYYKRKDLSGGISEAEQVSVSSRIKVGVCPNPFSDQIKIRCWMLDTGYSINNLITKIFDISGKEVIYQVISKKAKGKMVKIDTKDLPCGVYFVEVRAGDRCVVKKVIKIE
jgi:Neuraminidase (sialidase)